MIGLISCGEINQYNSIAISFLSGKVESRDQLLFDHRRPKKVTHDNLLEIKEHIMTLCNLHEVSWYWILIVQFWKSVFVFN